MLDCLKAINWKKTGVFAAGVLFGTAGIKVLSSKDAKKVYTNCTAAVLRAKECVMNTVTTVQENAGDIYADAQQINEDYVGKKVHLVCILSGSVFFTCELAKRITVPVTMDFMQCSSYGGDTKSSGIVRIVKDLDENIEGKEVIIIEDIIDSGRTLSYLLQNLKTRNPKSLKLCTLLDKPDRRVCDVKVDYVGFEIPDEFVVGYGLDYAQKYRNLPYIGVVEGVE